MKKQLLTVIVILLVAIGCKKDETAPVILPEIDYADIIAPSPYVFSISELTVVGNGIADPTKIEIEPIRIEKRSKNCLKTTIPFKVAFPSETNNKYKMVKLDSIPLVKVGDNYKIQTITQTVVSAETDPDPGVLTLDGEFVGNKLHLRMNIKSGLYNVNYVCVFEGKNTAAKILSFKVNHPSIIGESEFYDNVIICYVDKKDLNSKIKIVPEMEVSRGAKILMNGAEYTIGNEIELSISETEFIIISETEVEQTYIVKLSAKNIDPFSTNLDIWQVVNENGEYDFMKYDKPFGEWTTSNNGIYVIKEVFSNLYPEDSPYIVTKVPNGNGYAAEIITVDTEGSPFGIPKITTGSLFNGEFLIDMTTPLKSTKFGSVCTKNPVTFKGKYKYKAGVNYYRCPDPLKNYEAILDNTITDLPAINAILYEIDKDTETLDGTNLFTSPNIVARASVTDFKTITTFTEFDVNFVFDSGKTFNAAKKYKLAIVCSSSKDGDRFSGAPGSKLTVDDIEVVFQ